jgi:hypothetical protein
MPMVKEFVDLLFPWFGSKSPPLSRLAFGATVRVPVVDRKEGYRQLSAYLPFEIDADKSSNLLYQISRPRPSTAITGLTVNRLMQWAVPVYQVLSVAMVVGIDQPQVGPAPPSAQRFACQIVLDVNSAPDPAITLQRDQTVRLLTEFVALSNEIITEGDIP